MLIGWTALLLGSACALALLCDIALRGYHQRSAAMDVVWPLTALYLGPLAAWLYLRHARPATARWVNGHPDRPAERSGPRGAWAAFEHVGACGAGCLLGSVAGAVLVHRLAPAPLSSLEPRQAVSLVVLACADVALACVLGLAFQRLSAEQRARTSPARMLASVLVFQVAVLACIVVNRLVLRDSPQPPPVPA